MPVATRLKARSGQPPDLVTSPRATPPRRLTNSRQGNAMVVDDNTEVGSPSVITANGNSSVASFTLGKCVKLVLSFWKIKTYNPMLLIRVTLL